MVPRLAHLHLLQPSSNNWTDLAIGLKIWSEVSVTRTFQTAVLACLQPAGRDWEQRRAGDRVRTLFRLPLRQRRRSWWNDQRNRQAGAVPLPGLHNRDQYLTGKKYATTTDVTGSFSMAIPRNGRYVVRAELAAFAGETKEVLINAAGETEEAGSTRRLYDATGIPSRAAAAAAAEPATRPATALAVRSDAACSRSA